MSDQDLTFRVRIFEQLGYRNDRSLGAAGDARGPLRESGSAAGDRGCATNGRGAATFHFLCSLLHRETMLAKEKRLAGVSLGVGIVRKLRGLRVAGKEDCGPDRDAISPGLALLYKSLVGFRYFRRAPGRGLRAGAGTIHGG